MTIIDYDKYLDNARDPTTRLIVQAFLRRRPEDSLARNGVRFFRDYHVRSLVPVFRRECDDPVVLTAYDLDIPCVRVETALVDVGILPPVWWLG
jgi:hypothetical protein